MSGRITGISGPTVSVDLPGLRLYDRVTVGNARLMGEVVRLEKNRAIVQVYESTRGLGIGEPVEGTGTQLTVRLGPGLLGQTFDGLQRPLQWLLQADGPFMEAGREAPACPASGIMRFQSLKRCGDEVSAGETLGYVEEGELRHPVVTGDKGGIVSEILDGEFDPAAPLATLGRLVAEDFSIPRLACPPPPAVPPETDNLLSTGHRSALHRFPFSPCPRRDRDLPRRIRDRQDSSRTVDREVRRGRRRRLCRVWRAGE